MEDILEAEGTRIRSFDEPFADNDLSEVELLEPLSLGTDNPLLLEDLDNAWRILSHIFINFTQVEERKNLYLK